MQNRLQAADIQNADGEARWILRERTGVEWGDILAAPDTVLPMDKIKDMNRDLTQRISGMPLSRLYGSREFWGLDFDLGEDTLDPRPDTEILIETTLAHYKNTPPKIFADLGAGTGCIGIVLLTEWPEARCVAVDRSESALKIACQNARKHHVDDRFMPICGNWLESVHCEFDLVVSNPPYIPNQDLQTLSKEVQYHDPILALDGGMDGLQAYRDIFLHLNTRLNSCGRVFMEIGFNQYESIMRLSEDSGFFVQDVHRDLSGWPRVVDIIRGDKVENN